jgi:hypothetical protein
VPHLHKADIEKKKRGWPKFWVGLQGAAEVFRWGDNAVFLRDRALLNGWPWIRWWVANSAAVGVLPLSICASCLVQESAYADLRRVTDTLGLTAEH